ncbi:MAG: hypothetical protein LBN35_03145 [Clostridiales Family XIII bacterium]|jgi:hypothetical protein|nr:hypothetical protein [Clostridiales Family XIII bacterium]
MLAIITALFGSAIAAFVGIVLVLIAFFLQGSLRKRGQGGIIASVVSVIGALGSLYFVYLNITRLIEAPGKQTSAAAIITVHIPVTILSIGLLALFVILFLRKSVNSGAVVKLDLALLAIVILQFALYAFNLITHWGNYANGMTEFLYIQILLLVIAAVSVLLFALVYKKNKRALA